MKSLIIYPAFLLSFFLFFQTYSYAARGGGASISGDNSFGVGIGLLNSNQSDMNRLIDSANSSAYGPISTKSLGSAYELYAQYEFRFSRTGYALIFRPSYVTQSSTGSGSNGSYDYKLSGFTFFPIFRMYPLEGSFLKFFMQMGLGWGKLSADVTTGSGNTTTFDGNAFGGMAGLGVDFCFTETHCMTIEGNVRYLPIERNTASSASGTIVGVDNPIGAGSEVEISSKDLATTLSGIQGILAYKYNF